jgi:hypothetical protein
LVFTHHPPFTQGVGRHPDEFVVEHLLPPFLASPKAKVMFSAHVHGYERFGFANADKIFVVTGGAGGPRVEYEAPPVGDERTQYRHPHLGLRPFNYVRIQLLADALDVETKCLGSDNGCTNGKLDAFSVALSPAGQKNCDKKSTEAVAANGGQK